MNSKQNPNVINTMMDRHNNLKTDDEITRLKSRIIELESELNKLRNQSKQNLINPYQDGIWDILMTPSQGTHIYRALEAEKILDTLSDAIKTASGYYKGADQNHVYNVAILTLGLMPNLPDLLVTKLKPKKGLVSDRNKAPIYEALWKAILESLS